MTTALKPRSEMDPKYLWRLEDIFPTDEAAEQEISALSGLLPEIGAGEGKTAEDPKGAVVRYFDLSRRLEKVFAYAMMRADQDGSDGRYTAMLGRVRHLAVQLSAAFSYLEPELLALPEEKLAALQNDPSFSDYSEYLRGLTRTRAHTLPAEQEKLLAMAEDALSAPSQAFRVLSDVELPFPVIRDENGEEVQLSHGRYQTFLRSRDREVRKAAFLGMHNTYRDFGGAFAALYGGSVRRHVFKARARRYDSALVSALDPDEVPVSVFENLLAEVDRALPAMDEYLEIRKRLLALDELHMYDLYVPMFGDVSFTADYEQGCALTLEALSPMGEEYLGVMRRAFSEGWIDVYENKAKRSGAYSNGVYGVHPYMLLNYENDLDSVSTLAHEMGHSLHTYFSAKCQPYPKADYSLFVAEVASTCNEVLLSAYLRRRYRDDKPMLRYLLNSLLESFRTTVIRQTMFAAFEKKSHEMAEAGQPLTKETLTEAYLDLNRHYYGRSVHVDEEIGAEWMRIPHFYRDFYVYKYATGFSAAVCIADRILKEGEPAVRDHIRFLSAGSSVPPIEALKYAGVDMGSPEPVRRAMNVFRETVEELKALL